MRFCPFCAQENSDDVAQCAQCGKRLPAARKADAERKELAPGAGTPTPTPPGAPRPAGAGAAKPNLPSRPQLAPRSPLRARAEAIMAGTVRPGGLPANAAAPPPVADPAPPTSGPARRTPLAPTLPLGPAATPPSEPKPERPDGATPLAAAAPEAPANSGSGAPRTRVPGKNGHGVHAAPAAGAANQAGDPPALPSALPPPPMPTDFNPQLHTPTGLRDATGKAPATSEEPSELAGPAAGSGLTVAEASSLGALAPAPGLRAAADRAWRATRNAVDVQAVRYVFNTARDNYKKKGEIGRLRKLNVADQEKLDGLLGQLGQRARAADLAAPALADEMHAAKALEVERAGAQKQVLELSARRSAELERFGKVDADMQGVIGKADEQVLKISEDLAARTSERAGHRAGMNRLEEQLKMLARQRESKEAELMRAAEPNQQGVLRGEIDALAVQLKALEPERDRFAQKAADLQGPVAELETNVAAAREEAARLRRDLADALRAHQDVLAQIDRQRGDCERRIAHSERELSLKFVTLGTLLNLNRVASPELDPLYAAFDDIKAAMSGRDEQIAHLDSEIKNIDRTRLHKGILVLGGGFFLLLVLIAIIVH
jgi:chromosome segregation ATPase